MCVDQVVQVVLLQHAALYALSTTTATTSTSSSSGDPQMFSLLSQSQKQHQMNFIDVHKYIHAYIYATGLIGTEKWGTTWI